MTKIDNFGSRLKELIKKSKFNQKELADIWEINQVTLTNYITGKRIPGIDLIEKISQTLNVSTDYLINGKIFNENLSNDEEILLTNYRRLAPEHKTMILNNTQLLAGSGQLNVGSTESKIS